MEFRILGPLQVADGGSVLRLAGAKQRALLALLLLSANETVSSDRLIEELWGGQQPESGRAALQVRVSQVRKAPCGRLLPPRAQNARHTPPPAGGEPVPDARWGRSARERPDWRQNIYRLVARARVCLGSFDRQ
jgi:hypothetical protein